MWVTREERPVGRAKNMRGSHSTTWPNRKTRQALADYEASMALA